MASLRPEEQAASTATPTVIRMHRRLIAAGTLLGLRALCRPFQTRQRCWRADRRVTAPPSTAFPSDPTL